jgi:hypothetical protein
MKEVLSLAWLLFMAGLLFGLFSGLQIHLIPFSIKFPYWRQGLGIMIILIGSVLVASEWHERGRNQGFNEAKEVINSILRKKQHEKESRHYEESRRLCASNSQGEETGKEETPSLDRR